MHFSSLNPEPRTLNPRRGYTLAEMLIVMTIMLMLVAITLPAIKNVMQDGNVREASRQLNAYFSMAKARALQTGRPCGVMMICDPSLVFPDPPSATPNIPLWPTKPVTKLYLAEVPPPYSGGTIGAKGRIMPSQQAGVPAGTYSFYPLVFGGGGIDSSEVSIMTSLIAPGEIFLVRFDNKGPWYACHFVSPAPGANAEFVFQAPAIGLFWGLTGDRRTVQLPGAPPAVMTATSAPLPPGATYNTFTLPGYTYQMLRLPRRIGNPLELSGGTCIDLAYSGIGPTNFPSNTIRYGMYPADPTALNSTNATQYSGLFPTQPQALRAISIMFTPGGGIDSVFLNNYFFTPPTTVHFLIGRSDKVNAPLGTSAVSPTGFNMYDPAASNLADPLSLWVSIARSTGNVVTSDNQPPTISAASPGSMTILGGGTSQTITPNIDAGQAIYLSFCRQLATSREQSKTQ